MSECGDLGGCFSCNDAPTAVPTTRPIALDPGIGRIGDGGGGGHLPSSSRQPNFEQHQMCYPNSSGSAAKVSGANAPFKSSQTGLNQSSNEKPPPLPPRHPLPAHNPKASVAPVFGSDSWSSKVPDSLLTPSFGGSLGQNTSISGLSYPSKPLSIHYSESGFHDLGIDDWGYSRGSRSHESSYRSQ
jgi:hypothetical protein